MKHIKTFESFVENIQEEVENKLDQEVTESLDQEANEALDEAAGKTPQPTEADIKAVAAPLAKAYAELLAKHGISRSYARSSIMNNGTSDIEDKFKEGGPLAKLREKGITPRKVSPVYKKLAIEYFNEMVKKGENRDS
jgi:hypothetical protein